MAAPEKGNFYEVCYSDRETDKIVAFEIQYNMNISDLEEFCSNHGLVAN